MGSRLVVILQALAQVFSKDAQLMQEGSCHLSCWHPDNSSGQLSTHGEHMTDLQMHSSLRYLSQGLGSDA